jgi:3-phosphoglycerate kinase
VCGVVRQAAALPADVFVLDVGSETRDAWAELVAGPKVGAVLLYGPLGVVEVPDCASTTEVMQAMAAGTKARGILTVVAGGATAVWARAAGVAPAVTVVSSGGPGVARLLSGALTPGVAALSPKP